SPARKACSSARNKRLMKKRCGGPQARPVAKKKLRGNPAKITPFQWKPGQSGNRRGRPRKEPLTDILREALAEKIPKGQDPRQSSLGQALIRNWVLEAIPSNDTVAITEICDRIAGKSKGRMERGGEDGEPIRIQSIDVTRFTDEELEAYEALIRKATTPRSDD